MIQSGEDIKHSLAHLEIGERVVMATATDKSEFTTQALTAFFEGLRNGHRDVLDAYYPHLADEIGYEEHDELDRFGVYGYFAGSLAVRESGLALIEHELHGVNPDGLQEELRASLVQAVAALRST